MLYFAVSWAVGAILLIVGILATTYLVWFQRKQGMSIFSVLATSDALITIIMAAGYFINATNQMTQRQVPSDCNHGQLFLATALFVGPFLNAFLAILCHSTTCSAALQSQKIPNIANKRFIGNISAKLLVPLLSVLLLFTTSVRQHPLVKQDLSEACPSYSSVNIFPVTALQLCDADRDTGSYIVDLMEHHSQEIITNFKNAPVINNTDFINNATSFIVNRIYNILQGLNTNKITKSIWHQQSNIQSYNDSTSDLGLDSHKYLSSHTNLRHLLEESYYDTEDPSDVMFQNEDHPEHVANITNHQQDQLENSEATENQYIDVPDSQNGYEDNFEDSEQPMNYITQAITLAVDDSSATELKNNSTLQNINDTFTTQSNDEQYAEELQHVNTEHSSSINHQESNAALPISILNLSYSDSNTTDQLIDTFGLCIFECYFSPTFLKTYLFILLFIGYFLPIVSAITLHATTVKGLTMQMKEATQQEKRSADDTNNMCTMQLMKLNQASNTNKRSIISSVLLWTPTLIETLVRVWFCVQSPTWLSTLLFLLGQSYTLVQNILNIKLVKCYSCITPVQPLPESSTCSADMPTTLFTKVEKDAAKDAAEEQE